MRALFEGTMLINEPLLNHSGSEERVLVVQVHEHHFEEGKPLDVLPCEVLVSIFRKIKVDLSS